MKVQCSVNSHGTKIYHIGTTVHRSDGPAIIYTNGNHHYYIFGREHTLDEYCRHMKLSAEDKLLMMIKYGHEFNLGTHSR